MPMGGWNLGHVSLTTVLLGYPVSFGFLSCPPMRFSFVVVDVAIYTLVMTATSSV